MCLPALAAQTAASWCTGSASASVSLVYNFCPFVIIRTFRFTRGKSWSPAGKLQHHTDQVGFKKEMFHALYALGNSN